jgi:atonal protein 8
LTRSPKFDAETCQVLSRLYPFLLNRGSTSQADEPEQEEPLALIKRSRSDDDDEVFLKQEGSDSGKDLEASSCNGGKSKQRNYKNMTRERRIEANARERQRVHTITAAFDRLQSAIPTTDDGSGSKLSKLSVIKIATSYIMVLSRMAGLDYSSDQVAMLYNFISSSPLRNKLG